MHDDIDDVDGRDRVGRLGRVKVVLVDVNGRSLRSDTFLPHESSPYIAADSFPGEMASAGYRVNDDLDDFIYCVSDSSINGSLEA